MWLSGTAQQVLNAVLCVAGQAADGPVRVDEITAVVGCPRNYLSKNLNLLVRVGVLRSTRGPRGGFELAIPADRLTLDLVVAHFEPVGERRCLVGRPTCGDANPCAAHARWREVADTLERFFRQTTIADLLRDNPRATAEARAIIQSVRDSNRRISDGSVA